MGKADKMGPPLFGEDMETEDKFMLGCVWFLTLVGIAFYSFEFGTMNGQQLQKEMDNDKLTNCQRVIAGSLYK